MHSQTKSTSNATMSKPIMRSNACWDSTKRNSSCPPGRLAKLTLSGWALTAVLLCLCAHPCKSQFVDQIGIVKNCGGCGGKGCTRCKKDGVLTGRDFNSFNTGNITVRRNHSNDLGRYPYSVQHFTFTTDDYEETEFNVVEVERVQSTNFGTWIQLKLDRMADGWMIVDNTGFDFLNYLLTDGILKSKDPAINDESRKTIRAAIEVISHRRKVKGRYGSCSKCNGTREYQWCWKNYPCTDCLVPCLTCPLGRFMNDYSIPPTKDSDVNYNRTEIKIMSKRIDYEQLKGNACEWPCEQCNNTGHWATGAAKS